MGMRIGFVVRNVTLWRTQMTNKTCKCGKKYKKISYYPTKGDVSKFLVLLCECGNEELIK